MVTIWSPSPWVEERRESISFALEVFPIRTGHEPARHLLTARRLAGSLSFDAFYFGDHPTWALDCWVHMAALAVTTSRIRLGLIANCVYYRHPVQTARFAADLDNLSDGRLILGVGIGWEPRGFANFGQSFPPRRNGRQRWRKRLPSSAGLGARRRSPLTDGTSRTLARG